MIDKKAIAKYHKRMDARLKKRGVSLDGIRRFDADWDENEHPRDKGGQFTSKNGGSAAKGEEKKNTTSEKAESVKKTSEGVKEAKPIKMNKVEKSQKYVDSLSEAKKSLPPEQAPWRVTQYENGDQFDEWHPNAKKFSTDGGSTVAVTPDGDIVGVCHKDGDPARGKELIRYAVENGGKKLDAYEGLYPFYTKCGFEPVSWCKWDENFAPDDWVKGRDNPENIIFYKYTGNKSKYNTAQEFFAGVKASKDYDEAMNVRNKEIEV